jgi:hypothetical protein
MWKRIALGAVGTILLGALGSGLWELAFKPAGRLVGNGILTAATLGSSALKDRVYVQAAKGYHEASANSVFEILALGPLFFSALVFLAGRHGFREPPKRERIEAEGDLDAEIKRLERELKVLGKQGRILAYSLAFLLLFNSGMLIVENLTITKADDAYAFFAQSMTICRPYISDHDAQVIESHFASIRGRGDYINTTDELRRVAASNHLILPDYRPW